MVVKSLGTQESYLILAVSPHTKILRPFMADKNELSNKNKNNKGKLRYK